MGKGKPRHDPDKPQNKLGGLCGWAEPIRIRLIFTASMDITLGSVKEILTYVRKLGIEVKLVEVIVERISMGHIERGVKNGSTYNHCR